MFMSICYVLSPVKLELSSLIHSTFHFFEKPANVLQHDSTEKWTAHHKYSKNQSTKERFNHHIILDFFKLVVDDFDNPFSSNLILEKVKINKHITTNSNYKAIVQIIPITKSEINTYTHNKTQKGYKFKIKKPPKKVH